VPPRRADPRRTLGADGEALVATWYEERGYQVVDRNWRSRDGELDLVIRGEGVVVFCEVKTRSSKAFGIAEAVTAAKVRRIRRLAAQWLAARRVRAPEVRFDVAAVLARRGRPLEIDVIESAF
jgi:putative endonuclease